MLIKLNYVENIINDLDYDIQLDPYNHEVLKELTKVKMVIIDEHKVTENK